MRPDPTQATDQTTDQTPPGPPSVPPKRRVSVKEAAEILGTTVEGVRSRIRRGTLAKEKAEDGSVYILLDPDQTNQNGDQASTQTTDQASPGADRTTNQTSPEALLIEELRAHNEYLRSELSVRNEELRRKDHILLSLSEGIKSLEAPRETPPEPRGADLSASEEYSKSRRASEHTDREKRSWWSRLFLGPD